ncbi:hypothetical protein PYCCODRAFT_1465244 [Trametes coccinea BRFM310]|uniref:Uncharacterized protein n=1 Tax=Trametes coccinea (strain BRFM310) TaxID=1353009 RepID=A0A1Y2IW11_TRAC3|nr:hypothetical protein PYCCODRAFT_1465244 [Trametes coccinea BRFM310]
MHPLNLSLQPYYGPREDPQLIDLERYFLAGDFVSGVGYGILLILWTSCTVCLWNKRKGSWTTLALLCYITLLLFIETGFSIVQARTVQMIYIENRNYPGGPWDYFIQTQDQPLNIIFYSTFFAATFLCDMLMLWRNWIIWSACSPIKTVAYLVNLAPVVMLAASFGMGILWIFQSSHAGFSLYSKQARTYGIAYCTLSLGLNVVLTVLIIMRLLLYRRSLLKYLPAVHSQHYVSLCSMIVESAALYSAFAVTFLVSYAIKAPINALWLAFASAAQPIATYLIIYRVADGKAWTQETVSAQTTHSVVFRLQTGSSISPKERVAESMQTASAYGAFTLELPTRFERVAELDSYRSVCDQDVVY